MPSPAPYRLIALLLFVIALPVHASILCVDSVPLLRYAIEVAMANDDDNTIQIVRGTYLTAGSEFYFHTTAAHSLAIEGGFSPGCQSQQKDPRLTVLDGGGQSRVLDLQSAQGNLLVRYLTIQNGYQASNSNRGAGMEVNGSASTGSVTISYNIIRNNRSEGFEGGVSVGSAGGIARMKNNLIVGNYAKQGNGGGSFVVNGTAFGYFMHNTVVRNLVGDGNVDTGGMYFYSNASLSVSNNIFWSNAVNDVRSTAAVLLKNDYGVMLGTPASGSGGNQSVDPKFVNDADAGADFHLRTTSMLIDAGATSPPDGVPATDIENHARDEGAAPDPGAYEYGDAIFGNAFDY